MTLAHTSKPASAPVAATPSDPASDPAQIPATDSASISTSASASASAVDNSDDEFPNEQKYCLCNDIRYGIMVACEYKDCKRGWFHLDCVQLEEIPGRRRKWFCPDCRVGLDVDENGCLVEERRCV